MSEEWIWGTVAIALMIVAGVGAIMANEADTEDCHHRGGVMHCTTGSGTGIGTNGKVTIVTTESCDCYWPDGRVLIR